jgi:hypothetical protein
MARLARIVVPGAPRHVARRGDGGARTFFVDEDYAFYKEPLGHPALEALGRGANEVLNAMNVAAARGRSGPIA